MIRFQSVTKSFGSKEVLRGADFEVKNGEIVFLLGRSGQGKSVCLKLLVGLLALEGGTIVVDGIDVRFLTEKQWLAVRRRCGMVFQFPALLDSLSVYENLVFGLRGEPTSETEKQQKAEAKLRLVGLDRSWFDRFPPTLSFTVQKRVSIARCLVLEPQYLLFDEPTTGQDPIRTHAFYELVKELSSVYQITSLIVSHDIRGAVETGHRILMLEGGKIVFTGTPSDLLTSRVPLARSFLKGSHYGE